jgi:hypothetical protein
VVLTGRNWKRAQPYGPVPRQFLTQQLFFKWIKQHLRIKRFYGTSENAVRTQIWIAISVYVLVAIIKKKLRLNVSLHTLLQILSLTLFEKLPLKQAVAGIEPIAKNPTFHSQLNLFEF